MTDAQTSSLKALCERFKVAFNPEDFRYAFGLPDGYVAGQVGPIYVGCDPDGAISS